MLPNNKIVIFVLVGLVLALAVPMLNYIQRCTETRIGSNEDISEEQFSPAEKAPQSSIRNIFSANGKAQEDMKDGRTLPYDPLEEKLMSIEGNNYSLPDKWRW